ncbi:MAG: arginine--tRNA ligase [Patescibacteria group bacterium]|nr:MAG: arginine--tRNA ligase [Patescibacteria group bacterium]
MVFKSEIKRAVKKAVKELYQIEVDPVLEHPAQDSYGDYSTNVAMVLARQVKTDPLEVARRLAEAINGYQLAILESIEAAPPGFVNFRLAKEALLGELNCINRKGERFGESVVGKGKTVLIDYSSPNVAKPFGIGHLRSTIVGQALYNLYSFAGYRTIGENFLGDWGTQFGKLIYALKTWGDEKELDASERPINILEDLYVRFQREAEKDSRLEEEGRFWFKKLEEGDKEARRIWKKLKNWSLAEFEKTYRLLGVKIDRTTGESVYADRASEVIADAGKKGIAVESEGALVIFFPEKEGLPPLILRKSDGATTYESRDLATIKARKEKFKPGLVLYEVGADQTLHFKQLFLAAQMLGYAKPGELVHVAHGLYRFAEGKMSTRLGRTIHLEDVLSEAVERARKLVECSLTGDSLSKKEVDEIARAVGIGAVKYNDLSQHYTSEVVFDWEKILNLQGNSAPYLQYTYARAVSVLEKARGEQRTANSEQLAVSRKPLAVSEAEAPLLRWLYRFPEIVEEAVKVNSPNLICNFLFELARRFNAFYAELPIIKAENEQTKRLRLAITAATGQTIKNGLTLLGISAPEKL